MSLNYYIFISSEIRSLRNVCNFYEWLVVRTCGPVVPLVILTLQGWLLLGKWLDTHGELRRSVSEWGLSGLNRGPYQTQR